MQLLPDVTLGPGVQNVVMAVGQAGNDPQDVAIHCGLTPAKSR